MITAIGVNAAGFLHVIRCRISGLRIRGHVADRAALHAVGRGAQGALRPELRALPRAAGSKDGVRAEATE